MIPFKKPLFLFLLTFSTVSLTLYSCKKERVLQTNKQTALQPQALEDGDLELGERIESFYATMQELEPGSPPSMDSIDVDSAEFLIEATYNYYCARVDYESEMQNIQFEITKPLQGAGYINLKDAADAFWEIKQMLVDEYNNISYDDKALSFFDLELVIEGDNVHFIVNADISKSIGFTEPTTTDADGDIIINQPSNHVWGTIGINTFAPISAQGTLSTTPNLNVSVASGQNPGAMEVLEKYGTFNYISKYASGITTSLIVNVSTGWRIDAWKGNEIPTSSPSEYFSLGLPGYNPYAPSYFLNAYNGNIWMTWHNYGTNGIALNTSANNTEYKEWLTTSMMNFYLKYLPGIVQNGLINYRASQNNGSQIHFRKLNIGGSQSPINQPYNYNQNSIGDGNPYSYYARRLSFEYTISFCRVTQKLLPTGKPLPNL